MTDRLTVRLVVVGLALIAIAVITSLILALLFVDLEPQDRGTIIGGLVALGTGAGGALGAVLASTRSGEGTAAAAVSPPAIPPPAIPLPGE